MPKMVTKTKKIWLFNSWLVGFPCFSCFRFYASCFWPYSSGPFGDMFVVSCLDS